MSNPKDTVSKAYSNLQSLETDGSFDDVINRVQSGTYQGDAMDLVDALSLPIFMLSDALDGMNQVVKITNEINHEKMMAIIFGFLSAIFFLIPIAGEVAGSVFELASIARIAALAGALGDTAMSIYQVVSSHGNDPLDIIGLILSPLALFDAARVASAASVRRGMKEEDIKGLGSVGRKLDQVEVIKARGVCRLPTKRDVFSLESRFATSPASMPHKAAQLRDQPANAFDALGNLQVTGFL